jgi:hypothetical protein
VYTSAWSGDEASVPDARAATIRRIFMDDSRRGECFSDLPPTKVKCPACSFAGLRHT